MYASKKSERVDWHGGVAPTFAKSFLSVLIRMSDTRPQRKITIMKELKMENQWIWCSKNLGSL